MSVKLTGARHDEHRKYHGGKAGDQTGTEVSTRDWYYRPWTIVYVPKKAVFRCCYSELSIKDG